MNANDQAQTYLKLRLTLDHQPEHEYTVADLENLQQVLSVFRNQGEAAATQIPHMFHLCVALTKLGNARQGFRPAFPGLWYLLNEIVLTAPQLLARSITMEMRYFHDAATLLNENPPDSDAVDLNPEDTEDWRIVYSEAFFSKRRLEFMELALADLGVNGIFPERVALSEGVNEAERLLKQYQSLAADLWWRHTCPNRDEETEWREEQAGAALFRRLHPKESAEEGAWVKPVAITYPKDDK